MVDGELVSVIMPTHNRAHLLERSMRSVLSQTYRNIELIVVDDASTDETERVVEGIEDRRVRYIRHETNRGAAAARNTGIEASSGPYIAFQDSDDEWLVQKLERQMRVLLGCGPGVDAIYCGFLLCNSGSAVYVPGDHVKVREGDILAQLLRGNFVSTQTLLVRRACIQDAGLFDERLPRFQDWELAIRLAERTSFRLIDEPLVVVHTTPQNISSDPAAGARALAIILEKHRVLLNRHPSRLSRLLCRLAHLHCLSGALADGRAEFANALRVQPHSARAWAALCVTLFGTRAYRRIAAAI